MALPADLSTFTLRGKYKKLPEGTPLYGKQESVTVTYPVMVNDPGEHTVLVPRRVVEPLDQDGAFLLVLPVTQDSDLVPDDYPLTVVENFPPYRTLTFSVPDGTDTIWIDQMSPGSPPDSGAVVYATFAQLLTETSARTAADTTLGQRLTTVESTIDGLGTAYVKVAGDQNVSGIKTFDSFPVGPSQAPADDYQLANKKYVDDHQGSGGDAPAPTAGVIISNLVGYGSTIVKAANCTAGTKTVTLTTGTPFTSANVGDYVILSGADSDSVHSFVGHIATVNSSSSIDLDRNVITTVANATMMFGKDETATFQADVDAAEQYALLHGGRVEIHVPVAENGHFVIAGPLLHDRQGNAQVMSPVWPTTGPKCVIDLVGVSDGAATQHWETEGPNFGGSTFVSYFAYASVSAQNNDVNDHGHSAMFGGPTEPSGYTQGGKFNNVQITFRNIQIRNTHTRDGLCIGAAYLGSCASAGVDHFAWGTTAEVAEHIDSVGNYGNGLVAGLIMPMPGNNDLSYVSNATCHGGYTYDLWVSEHTDFYSVRLLYGWAGLCVVGTYWSSVGTTHGVNGFLSIEGCSYFLYLFGPGSGGNGPYLHLTIDTEGTLKIGDNSGGSGLPSLSVTGQIYLMGEIDQDTFSTDYPIGFDVILANSWYPNKGVSANWTVDTFTKLVVVDASSADITLNLPTADGRSKPVTVVLGAVSGGHSCTVKPYGSETINGETEMVLTDLWGRGRYEPYAHNWVQTA